MTDPRWEAERKSYEFIVSGIVGRDIFVEEAKNGELGYTSSGNTIYVAKEHPLFSTLKADEAAVLRYGICVHEALHQVFTNFNYMKKTIARLQNNHMLKNDLDTQMFCTFVNLVEDPAIENMAESIIGGTPLNALEYTIGKIYELSGNFSKGCQYPIEEIINALVQFGNLGILKGEFQFQSARNIFLKVAKPFYDALNETDGKKRIDAVFAIYAECSRLWAGFTDLKKNNMMQAAINRAQKQGKGSISQEASGNGSQGTCNPDSKKQKRRARTLDQIEEKQKGDANNPKDNQENASDTASASSEKNSVGNAARQESTKENAGKNQQEPSSFNSSKSSNQDKTDQAEESECKTSAGSNAQDLNDALSKEELAPELPEKDRDNILDSIFSRIYSSEKESDDINRYHRDFEKFEDLDGKKEYKNIRVINRYANEPASEQKKYYDRIVSEMQAGISQTVDELREIFLSDRARKIYCETGRASMKRFASGKVTTRLFQKRRATGHKMDMCVMVIGDHSGSMWGQKIEQEKCAVIALAEIFAEFDIPFYFMGFNVLGNRSPVQTHYIRWDNTPTERYRLMHFHADGSNFDSYSIRYATKLLEERGERHKLLLVLSDGLPSFYGDVEMGIQENTLAINEAKMADIGVVGFGIGTKNDKKFHQMYGKEYFVKVTRPEEMFVQIAERITTVVENWD